MTKEDFYFNFGFINIFTNELYIDETIIRPFAYFNNEPVELNPCSLDKFGSKYTKMFDELFLDQFYFFPEFNYTLRPYLDYFYIYVLPCENSTENNNECMPKDFIERFIDATFLYIRLQDVMITQ